jgi:phenylacetate-coenzyme A ligase PaaK-like adenylate-forming protein
MDLNQINSQNFQEKALEVFQYQYTNNDIYRDYCDLLKTNEPKSISEIPFLPIQFFKTHKVSCFSHEELNYFESSGTSGQLNSNHYIKDITIYHQSIELGFNHFFGHEKYTIVGLLPHYLERQNSSLVHMVRHWMQMNLQEEYFFLHDFDKLNELINQKISEKEHIILIGLSSALLDFSKLFTIHYSLITVIETGGMKGARPEVSKAELVQTLSQSFSEAKIISEYGMCELFSQAYSDSELWFSCPPWMKVFISELNDPLTLKKEGRGIAKIIDLANTHSCSFIETQDLIQIREDGKFQILGRVDNSDLRGCSLMYS